MRRHRIGIIIGASALVVAGAVAVSATGQGTTTGPITGCWNPKTGAMRVLAVGSLGTRACRKGEQRVTWNTSGARGGDGATGAQGAGGPTGAQGPAGPTGADGTNGTNGTDGAGGVAGANGTDGRDGTDGIIDKRGFSRSLVNFYTAPQAGYADRIATATLGWDGNPIISSAFFGPANEHTAFQCQNLACTSSSALANTPANGVPNAAATTIVQADGAPAIVQATNTTPLGLQRCTVNATFAITCPATTIPLISGTPIITGSSWAIGSDGLLVGVVRRTDGSVADRLIRCLDADCTSTSNVLLQTGSTSAPSLVIGVRGYPFVAVNPTGQSLRAHHCADVACTTAATTTILNVGTQPSVAIGLDGFPVIAAYRSDTGDLSVAHCSNVECSASTVTVVDSAGDVGAMPSIAVGPDGLPVVAYSDTTNGDLKFAHCSTVDCASAITYRFDTPGATDGVGATVLFGPDGLPLITYAEVLNTAIYAIHCSSVFCTPHMRPR